MDGNQRDRYPADRGRATPTAPIGKGDTPNIAGSDVQQPEVAPGPVAGLQPDEQLARGPWRPPLHVDPPPGFGDLLEAGGLGSPLGSEIIQRWPGASRAAAQRVIVAYGEPDEATASWLTWHRAGPWKRVVVSRAFAEHAFPTPHVDSVETFIDYRVPPEKCTPLAQFDGSVTVERTVGEVSARCHDEQANLLALNLMYDIVQGHRSVEEARSYYAQEFSDHRRQKPTPYMEMLHFKPGLGTADPDVSVLSDDDLERAVWEGERRD